MINQDTKKDLIEAFIQKKKKISMLRACIVMKYTIIKYTILIILCYLNFIIYQTKHMQI